MIEACALGFGSALLPLWPSLPLINSNALLVSLWALRKKQDKAVEEKHQAEVTSPAFPSHSLTLDTGESHRALGLVL